MGPPPNYTLRRLVAVTVVVLVGLALLRLVDAVTGGGDDDASVAAVTTAPPTSEVRIEVPPPCEPADKPTVYAREDDWFRTIVDVVYAVPEQYHPPDLVPASEANYSAEYMIRELIAADLNEMRNAILNQGIPEVALLAGYRSIEDQAALYNRREQELGPEAAADGTARPGHSEHHLGTTIDVRPIGASDVDQSFGDTETGQWLAANSWKYGFVLSYPRGAEEITCYKYEPWHFRYVGKDLAKRIHDSGLPLRQYLWHWEVTGSEPGVPLSAPRSSTTAVVEDDAG